MSVRQPTAEMFLRDVAAHEMSVALSKGTYRHIRFRVSDKGWYMWFDLVTWPGYLTISGDMGCWTFARLPDMFEFFRRDELSINASYWSEKLQHGQFGGRDGAKREDDDLFREGLLQQLSGYYGLEGQDLQLVSDALREDVLSQDGLDLKVSARDFQFTFEDGRKFQFDTCELPSGKDYSYHFIWCLYAIVWGIQKWDARQTLESRILEYGGQ